MGFRGEQALRALARRRRCPFEAARGEILVLLGPNGAGKTTTMRTLSCHLSADTGSATVAGFDVAASRA